jgi:cytosine/adenosine deaminase-related metal-dependent hydrolase
MSARDCLRMATMGGARCLGRDAELGSLEPGKAADLAVWRTGQFPGAGIADPVTTLVFGAPALEHLFVGGRQVVADGELRTADPADLAAAAARASAVIAAAP